VGARGQRRRNMAQGFATGGALLGADKLRTQPVASGFTTWIDALNGGARHEGHNALSPWLPAHPWMVSFPWRPSQLLGGTKTGAKLLPCCNEESMKNSRQPARKCSALWKKTARHECNESAKKKVPGGSPRESEIATIRVLALQPLPIPPARWRRASPSGAQPRQLLRASLPAGRQVWPCPAGLSRGRG